MAKTKKKKVVDVAAEIAKLEDRIKAGNEVIRRSNKRLKKSADEVAALVLFAGSPEAARRLSPVIFSRWEALEKSRLEGEALMSELEGQLEALHKP